MTLLKILIPFFLSVPSHAQSALLTFQQVHELPEPARSEYFKSLVKAMDRVPAFTAHSRKAKKFARENSQTRGVFFELPENEVAWFRFALRVQLACSKEPACRELYNLSANSQFKGWGSK